MFHQSVFFGCAIVAANLLSVTSSGPTIFRSSLPAPVRAAAQQDARDAVRTAVRPIPGVSGRDPAEVGVGLKSDGRGVAEYIETLRRRIDTNEAELRALRAKLQRQQADFYTGGQTEEQRKAFQ
jgi:hypothetical protein